MNNLMRHLIGIRRTHFKRLLISGVLHTLGALCVAALLWTWMLPPAHRASLHEAMDAGALGFTSGEVLLHLALSACFWAFLAICYHLFRSARSNPTPRLVKARGTVITETIIVFPVFLLLTMGLIQLTIVNTAGLLTSLAAYKAGRVAAVWSPEMVRDNIDANTVHEKMHVAAAASVAPVAPSDFVQLGCDFEDSTTLQAMLDANVEIGHVTDLGPVGRNLHGFRGGQLSITRAFDHSNFIIRGQRKLKFANCAVSVSVTFNPTDNRRGTATATVQYKHMMAIPIAEVVFGSADVVGGRAAHYSEIVRQYEVPYQFPPRLATPGGFINFSEAFGGTDFDMNDIGDFDDD